MQMAPRMQTRFDSQGLLPSTANAAKATPEKCSEFYPLLTLKAVPRQTSFIASKASNESSGRAGSVEASRLKKRRHSTTSFMAGGADATIQK